LNIINLERIVIWKNVKVIMWNKVIFLAEFCMTMAETAGCDPTEILGLEKRSTVS
jgi:hypothetical protein